MTLLDKSVDILLATYNGEKYLDDQLQSLFEQTYKDVRIIVRDDGSTDRTPEILARWANRHREKMNVIIDARGNLGWRQNFARLMEASDAPYFALCDQDDVWLPNKLALLVERIRALEEEAGIASPILVHSDLQVVDANLNQISTSLFRYWNLDIPRARSLSKLIFNNVVVGCSLVGNRSLLDLAQPMPESAMAHDWWLALVAASCGVVDTLPEATILYRQHGKNQLGAGSRKRNLLWDSRHILQRPRLLAQRAKKALNLLRAQARDVLSLAGTKMPEDQREFLLAFCLPQFPDEARGLSWEKVLRLRARVLAIYAVALPRVLRWCF